MVTVYVINKVICHMYYALNQKLFPKWVTQLAATEWRKLKTNSAICEELGDGHKMLIRASGSWSSRILRC